MIASICIVLKIVYEVYRNTSSFSLNTKKMIGFDHIPHIQLVVFLPSPPFLGSDIFHFLPWKKYVELVSLFLFSSLDLSGCLFICFFFIQLLFFSIFGFWSG